MNKKESKVLRLWAGGTHDLKVLARRLGYEGNSLTVGIERVRHILLSNGIKL